MHALELTPAKHRELDQLENEWSDELLSKMWGFHLQAQRKMRDVLMPEQQAEWRMRVGEVFEFESRWPGLSALTLLR